VIDRTGEIRSTRAPQLRDDQIEILRRYGQKRKTQVGDILFRAGDTGRSLRTNLRSRRGGGRTRRSRRGSLRSF
jgi:hypothetical protein